jgi:hypothetical protein
MIYSRLEGTTSSSFKLGKGGITIFNENGQFKVIVPAIGEDVSYQFIIGIDELSSDSNDIPTAKAIASYIQNQIGNSLEGSYLDLNAEDAQIVKSEVTFNKDVTIKGNLNVEGEINAINTTNLNVEDKTINLANGATTPGDASGAGITIAGANASILYNSTTDTLNINKPIVIDNTITFNQTYTGTTVNAVDSLGNDLERDVYIEYNQENFDNKKISNIYNIYNIQIEGQLVTNLKNPSEQIVYNQENFNENKVSGLYNSSLEGTPVLDMTALPQTVQSLVTTSPDPSIIVNRGSLEKAALLWKEQNAAWKVKDGDTFNGAPLEKKVVVDYDTIDGGTW